MSRRIKENLLNDHNLSFNMDDKDHLYSEYSDVYKEKYNIRPRWIHPNDVSVEELKQMLNDLHNIPDYDLDDNYHDYKGNEKYYDDLNAKHVTDAEIDDLANKGSEDGDEFHSFIGMGKNHNGKNKIYKSLIKENFKERSEKEQLFDVYSDIYKIKTGVRPRGVFSEKQKEQLSIEDLNKLIDELQKEPSYDEGELEENNKVTIGQLRQIIREELLKIKK